MRRIWSIIDELNFTQKTKNKMFIMIFMFVCLIQIIFIYYGGSIFRTYGLTFIELAKILLISFTVIPVDLLRKWFYKSKYNSDTF